MQRAGSVPFSSDASQMVTEDSIRNTFFEYMASTAVTQNVNASSLATKDGKALLTAHTLRAALLESKESQTGIRLLNGQVLSLMNCPESFKKETESMLGLKRQFMNREISPQALMPIAQVVCERDLFKLMIGDVMNFLRQASGEVLEDTVRLSFYSLMAKYQVTIPAIPKQDVEDQESYIYIALSAHALIYAMIESRLVKGGIALIEGQMTLQNCPPVFRGLLTIMLARKEEVCSLSEDQIELLKIVSAQTEGTEIPERLLPLRTAKLMQLASIINEVATKISQLPSFREGMIEKAREFILDASGSADSGQKQ